MDPEKTKNYMRVWRENNRRRIAVYAKKYRLTHAEKINEYQKTRRAKQRVESLIQKAVSRGWILRPIGMEFHHPDYSRPFYGVWLTRSDHSKIHNGFKACPECHDCSNQVIKAKIKSLTNGRIKGAIEATKVRIKNGTYKLNEDKVKNILRDNRTNRVISKDYGVSPSTIDRIKNKTRWEWVKT